MTSYSFTYIPTDGVPIATTPTGLATTTTAGPFSTAVVAEATAVTTGTVTMATREAATGGRRGIPVATREVTMATEEVSIVTTKRTCVTWSATTSWLPSNRGGSPNRGRGRGRIRRSPTEWTIPWCRNISTPSSRWREFLCLFNLTYFWKILLLPRQIITKNFRKEIQYCFCFWILLKIWQF